MDDADLRERVLEAARRDPIVVGPALLNIAQLEEAMLQAAGFSARGLSGFRALRREDYGPDRVEELMAEAIESCREVARAVARAGDDIDQIGQWISDNAQELSEAYAATLPPPRPRWWPFGRRAT